MLRRKSYPLTLASTVTSQLWASGGGIPERESPDHDSHEGKDGDEKLTGRLFLDAWGSHIRGCHVQRKPTYATPGGMPAKRRWNGRKCHPPSGAFLASIFHM